MLYNVCSLIERVMYMKLTSDMFTFIPVSDYETYCDWDLNMGFCGEGQLEGEDGIIVLTSDKKRFEENVSSFEEYMSEDED